MSPVQYSPRREPVAVCEKFKAEVGRMVEQDIIAPVTTLTPWVSSLLVVP